MKEFVELGKIRDIFPNISLSELEKIDVKNSYDVHFVSIFDHWLSHEEADKYIPRLLKKSSSFDSEIYSQEVDKLRSFYNWLFTTYQTYAVITHDFEDTEDHDVYSIIQINQKDLKSIISSSFEKGERFHFLIPELELIYLSGPDFTDQLLFKSNDGINKIMPQVKYCNLFLIH